MPMAIDNFFSHYMVGYSTCSVGEARKQKNCNYRYCLIVCQTYLNSPHCKGISINLFHL